jgi:DNA-binding NtrC family response regulator
MRVATIETENSLTQIKEQVMHALPKRQRDTTFVVLLATGDQQISEELKQALGPEIKLLVYDNAKDMLLAIADNPIDLVIFDASIAELKGVGILSVIKRFKPKVRVIALDDDLSFEKQAAMVKEGVIYQMQKSMNPRQISRVVEKVVEKLYARS